MQKQGRIHGICCSQQAKKQKHYRHTDRPTDGRTDGRTDTRSYRVASSRLKRQSQKHFLQILSNMILKKTVFFWVLKGFFGSNTYYLMGDTHFFFSEKILQFIRHTPCRKIWTFQVKKLGFDPKICLQVCHSFSDVFSGSNAHFLTSYNYSLASGSFFLANFMKKRYFG